MSMMAHADTGHTNPNNGYHRPLPFYNQAVPARDGLLSTHPASSLASQSGTPRLIQENIQSVFSELRPFVNCPEGGITNWLHRNRPLTVFQTPQHVGINDSVVISIEPSSSSEMGSAPNRSFTISNETGSPSTSENQDLQGNGSNNNNNNEDGSMDVLRPSPETREFLSVIWRYIPFVIILIAKGLYDHHVGILIFLALFTSFCYSNAVVRREIGKQNRRSLMALFIVACNLSGCILLMYIIFWDEKLYLSLVFIPPYTQPLTVWNLLWIVGVTDFVLKLITIIVKIGVAVLPSVVIPYQRRGKYYLFIEATSQFYRCLAPLQPWLYYLLESYEGPEKVVAVFLSAAYMVSKGTDVMRKARLWKGAFWKLLQNVNLGMSPNKDQLQTAGGQCPICHDEYADPVLLQCRHIFCEACVALWFDREQTCPLCRAKVVDDPAWRDGSTTLFAQLF